MTINQQNRAEFPQEEAHRLAWEELAQKIAATKNEISDELSDFEQGVAKQGELTILGSGIESVGFTMGDEELIKAADKVFYCVADPATVIWLKQLRPDAYDLYVLYNDDKVRFITYMQMSEAMLYYVRQGLKVVGIYYGHPGIFVLSTHRAISIARREGYQAIMKAGICALDCLCADLGVDPCHPGMQTHEATDMLIRGRKPDTSLHVVLWQVGLIGEMGFRRKGYVNHNFSVFIEYLQEFYGKDYPVINYVASRYPGIPPQIEEYRLEELHEPAIQLKVTGVSTFYLAPKDVVAAKEEMVSRLGLLKPGQRLKVPDTPLRIIDRYGKREMKAFSDFARFRIPKGYKWQEQTRAGEFIIALREDMELRDLYAKNPSKAVSEAVFPGLTEREKRLLATRDAGAIQIAAKGIYQHSETHLDFLLEVLNKKTLARELLDLAQQGKSSDWQEKLEQWSLAQDRNISWATLHRDIDWLNRNRLFAWSGVFLAEEAGHLICIVGSRHHNKRSAVFVNGQQLKSFVFQRGVLKWKKGRGNINNGFFRYDVDLKGRRKLMGKIWRNEEEMRTVKPFDAQELSPASGRLSQWLGEYERAGSVLSLKVNQSAGYPKIQAELDDQVLAGPCQLKGRRLWIGDQSFTLGGASAEAWKRASSNQDLYNGHYVVRSQAPHKKGMQQLELRAGKLVLDGQPISSFSFGHGHLQWTGGPRGYYAGSLHFLMDPIRLLPVLYGSWQPSSTSVLGKCFGTIASRAENYLAGPPQFDLPGWAWEQLLLIEHDMSQFGGLMLWHKWDKLHFTSLVVNKVLARI